MGASAPFSIPCRAILCTLLSPVFSPREMASSWWAEPFLPVGSCDPLHAADPRARDSQEFGHWWLAEARGWGGDGTRAGRNVWVHLAPALYRDPGGVGTGEAPTLQQAQYFQQSSSSRTGNRRRKMSRGMSHQKVPGGHSREERGGGGSQCHPPEAGLTGHPGPSLPARRLTLPPLHQDGAVGPGGAVTLHGVTVGTVVILIPEGAVFHHLLRCRHRHRPSAGHPTPARSTSGPGEGSAPHHGLALGPTSPITGLAWRRGGLSLGKNVSSRQTAHGGRGGGVMWGLPCPGPSKPVNLCLSWASLRSWASRTLF